MIARLIDKKCITDKDTLYVFHCPEIASKAKPGQFVEVRISTSTAPFLRRPISIFDCDGTNLFSLLVRTVGYGTDAMLNFEINNNVDILGPLGIGFRIREEDKNVLLIGGGIGLAPLYYLAKELKQKGKSIRYLFSPKRDAAILKALPEDLAKQFQTAENRTDLPVQIRNLIDDVDQIYTCGPEGLLETVAGIANEADIPCQLSMERRMGCGFGICVCCAIAIYTEEGLCYKKVCQDGPVFTAKEVAFHEKP